MTWILLLPVAGLLFLGLAAVDWTLYRLEQNEVHQSRFKGFGAAGLGLLLCWGATALRPSALRPSPALTTLATTIPSGRSDLGALQAPVAPALALTAAILDRNQPPTLAQARAERKELLAARMALAALPMGDEATVRVVHQMDTLLGVAYQAVGLQWRFTKEGSSLAQAYASAMDLLRLESERWEEMQVCVAEPRADCLKPPSHSERAVTLRSWQQEMRPYFLDTIRFSEVDPDLNALSVTELRTVRQHLVEGRSRLAAQPMPDWGAQVAEAANKLLLAADQALVREEIATAKGGWDRQVMAITYQPVQDAWDQLLNQALCALNNDGPCDSALARGRL